MDKTFFSSNGKSLIFSFPLLFCDILFTLWFFSSSHSLKFNIVFVCWILNDIAMRYITNDNHKRLNSAFVLPSLQLSVNWYCRWTFYYSVSHSVLLKLFLRTSIICNFLLKWHSIKQSKSISSGSWRIVVDFILFCWRYKKNDFSKSRHSKWNHPLWHRYTESILLLRFLRAIQGGYKWTKVQYSIFAFAIAFCIFFCLLLLFFLCFWIVIFALCTLK